MSLKPRLQLTVFNAQYQLEFACLWRSERPRGINPALWQTMNISLPETLKDFVDQQNAAGRYSTAGE